MTDKKKRIGTFIDEHSKTYQDISLSIHANPEVSDFEFNASKVLSEQLKAEGFEIELPAAGHITGFSAVYRSGKPGPTAVFLAGLGHGCGYNVFGATSALGVCGSGDVWRAVQKVLDDENYGLYINVVVFDAYNLPNEALNNGEIDLNAFQHVA